MAEALLMGVDIGGTKVGAGVVSAAGEMLFKTRVPMSPSGTAAQGFDAVASAIRAVLAAQKDRHISGIGVCSPGPLDPNTGVVINPPNLPCWRNFPLAEQITRTFGVSARIENDANAAALAEAIWGAGREYRLVFYATLGTGIGTGFVIDGRIYNGRTGAAPEGGHLSIDYNGPRCGCGKRGCIEALASGPAIAQRARDYMARLNKPTALTDLSSGDQEKITCEMVAQAHDAGDALATKVLTDTAELLTFWLGNVVDVLEPEVIVVGGGVSMVMASFFEDIRANLNRCAINQRASEIPIVHARYKDEAGIAGAAALVQSAAAAR